MLTTLKMLSTAPLRLIFKIPFRLLRRSGFACPELVQTIFGSRLFNDFAFPHKEYLLQIGDEPGNRLWVTIIIVVPISLLIYWI